jgi:hypothetical protein
MMKKIEVAVLVILTLVNIGILAYRAMHRAPKEPPRMVQRCFDSTDRYYTKEEYR